MHRFMRAVGSRIAASTWGSPVAAQPEGCSHGRFLSTPAARLGGSGASVALFFIHACLLLVCYYILKTLREPLLLASGSAEIKSYAQATIALVLLFFVPLYSAVRRRAAGSSSIRWMTLFFIASLVVLCGLGGAGVNVSFVYYVWVGVFGVTIIAQFWAHAADAFNVASGERVFPVIVAGATLGGLIGPLAFRVLFPLLGPWQLMLLVAALLAATLPLFAWSRRAVPQSCQSRRTVEATCPAPSRLGGFALVLRDRYLLLLAVLTVVLNCVNTTGEYLLAEFVIAHANQQAEIHPTLERADFIASFYANFFFIVNALTLVTQVLLVGRIFRWIGVQGAILVMPIIALIGYSLAAFLPVFSILRVVKIFENSADYSVMNTTRHTLYLPLSAEAKYEGKTAIETFFWRFGDLLQAAIIFIGLNWFQFSVQHFAMLNIGLSIVWLAIAIQLGRHYRGYTPDRVVPQLPALAHAGMRLASQTLPILFRRTGTVSTLALSILIATSFAPVPLGADSNVAIPVARLERLLTLETWSARDVRGARFEDDVARKGTLVWDSGEELTIKLRPAARRDEFNNVPRYELAAYHLQRLFLDPDDYVVPPTAFRALPLEMVREWGDSDLHPSYKESDQVFFVVQYWIQNVDSPAVQFDRSRFDSDGQYARHIANLNILTYLINHKDANAGNILLSTDPASPRAFCVDNGVAFRSDESEQGSFWKKLRVPAVPSTTVQRLRALDLDALRTSLRVVSQHQLVDGRHYVPTAISAPITKRGGVQRKQGALQLGLTAGEINDVQRRIQRLLRSVDKGRLSTF